MTVGFQDQSDVPAATAWHWDFGDGGESDDRNPVHQFLVAGSFDVRLTVTGAGGKAVRHRVGYVVVHPPKRPLTRLEAPLPATHALAPRP
jgi:PKD repeat protein